MGALKVTEQHSYNPHIVIYIHTYSYTYMFHRIWIGICHSGCLLLKTEPFCPGWFDTTYIHTCIYHTYIIHTYIHTLGSSTYREGAASRPADHDRPDQQAGRTVAGQSQRHPLRLGEARSIHTYIHTYIHYVVYCNIVMASA